MRIALGVIAGFFTWVVLWFVAELAFSAASPAWYGAHQRAFTAAIKTGSPFSADATILLIHIVIGAIACLLAGVLAAFVARENRHAPLILGLVLLAFGILKAVMSWPVVPIWYHLLFTAMLLPMTMWGGRLRTTVAPNQL